MSDNNSNGASIGFPALLTLLFVGLKLTKYITWSWWWVLSPIWLPLALLIFGFFIYWVLRAIRRNKLRR